MPAFKLLKNQFINAIYANASTSIEASSIAITLELQQQQEIYMPYFSSFSTPAFLIADHARAAMLTALLSGKALPAGELAYAAGVTPQTASAHLAKLLDGGLISVEVEGRHRYYRLSGPHIAETLEHLAAILPGTPVRQKALSPLGKQLRFCRCCYDHLAGQIGVAVTQGLLGHGYILAAADKQFIVTPVGAEWFDSIGLELATITPTRRGLARQCLDWTERTHHLAGPLGTKLTDAFCAGGWLRKNKDSRVIEVTQKGWRELKRHLDIEESTLRAANGRIR